MSKILIFNVQIFGNNSYYDDSDWHVENDEGEEKIMSGEEMDRDECMPKIYSRESGYVRYKLGACNFFRYFNSDNSW